ncbi:hypothetical protein ACFWA9_00185 [Kitasatospora sp. NPDC059973]|uniref:hypothetical protein n=1 Tax=Kitasatospora sp. NPDC059973 TaxID=3347020 RepID=UPI0036B43444
MRQRLITAATASTIVVGAAITLAPPASATITGCTQKYVTGSGGHRGAAITCKGDGRSRFQAAITCKRLDNGYEYRHDGPPEWAWPAVAPPLPGATSAPT